jgi:D-sedoheptulose 7-phosphate isomerase
MAPEPSPELILDTQHRESEAVIAALREHHPRLLAIARLLTASLQQGGTLYLCGNGGSAADAQHIAAEFVGRFQRGRRPLPAVSLTCNTSVLTAIGNDDDFSEVFARQVRAHAAPGDSVIGLSTSGRSANVLKAMAAARAAGATAIGFTGADGHELASLCDECLMAPSRSTPRIQESHLLAWHLICGLVERSVVGTEPDSQSSPATGPA